MTKLEAKWEKILAAEGMPAELPLCVQYRDDDGRSEYYTECGNFLYTHKFKNKEERKVWQLYAEGVPCTEIAKLVHKHVHTIHFWVDKLDKIMKEKING